MNIKDKVIAITGAAQGIGLSMAKALAQKGAKLALIDVNDKNLKSAVACCEELGSESRAYIANVANEEQVSKTFRKIVEDFGALNGLINNAGVTRDGLLIKAKDGKVESKLSLENWQLVIDVNLTGVFLCTREASACMVESGSEGVIVNISSISRAGNMGQTNYAATKAGVATMTVTWANELARYGIRCMGIAPGFIGTDMVMSMKPEALEKMAAKIPMKRLGEPEDIASTAVFIFENDYLTGRIIETDGGIRI